MKNEINSDLYGCIIGIGLLLTSASLVALIIIGLIKLL
jgi:hypothetical protein